VVIEAEPEPIEIELSNTAFILVDMQNAFVAEEGYFHLFHHCPEQRTKIVKNCKLLLEASRRAGLLIVYLKMVVERQMGAWGHRLCFFRKSRGLSFLRSHPEHLDRLYVEGSWGCEIVSELRPTPGEIVIEKRTYDGFVGTPLDLVLRGHGMTYLIFAGVATNVCVETTLRHAFCLGYFPILVSDATMHVGEETVREATILNVKSYFGWVTTLSDVQRALIH